MLASLALLLSLSAAPTPPYTKQDPASVERLEYVARSMERDAEFAGWSLTFERCLLTADLDRAACSYRTWFGTVILELSAKPRWHYDGVAYVRPQ